MLFNSYIFVLVFLPITLAGWYALNKIKKCKLALAFLTGMSLWFYGYFNKNYLLIIVLSMVGNYVISGFLALFEKDGQTDFDRNKSTCKKNEQNDSIPAKIRTIRLISMIAGVILNLGILFYYKYFDFFIENLNTLLKTDFNLRHILLPLGISFFTFQQLSYIIDRGLGRAQHYNFLEYAAFVTFFPQLVAGPIVLHTELVPQFKEVGQKSFDDRMFYNGLVSFVLGLSKKVLLADTFAVIANYGFDNALYLDTFSTICVMIAYSLELYFDFSGYSDMAIGLGYMFGITLPVNFNSPYKSYSLKNLWSRWHITLTRFMTTYVYIPLGGNRKGRVRTLINVFVVFLLSGLWHGAAWTYIVWGALTGIIVVWDNLGIIGFNPDEKKPAKIILPKWLGVAFTNFAFTMLLIPFRSPNLATAGQMCRNFLKGWTGNLFKLADATIDYSEIYILDLIVRKGAPAYLTITHVFVMLLLLVIGIFVITRKNVAQIVETAENRRGLAVFTAVLLVYCIVSFSQVGTFIYFNF